MELHDELGAVRREVVLPVTREEAWELVEDPRELEGWLADEVDLDLRPGAEGVVRWTDGTERAARVEEVEPGRRIALQWWAPGEEPTLVELTLDDTEGGTRLTVLEVPLRTLHAVGARIPGAASGAGGPQMAALACA
jgi:uncharacterized protein YndB with AHSA1/START domain